MTSTVGWRWKLTRFGAYYMVGGYTAWVVLHWVDATWGQTGTMQVCLWLLVGLVWWREIGWGRQIRELREKHEMLRSVIEEHNDKHDHDANEAEVFMLKLQFALGEEGDDGYPLPTSSKTQH
jgi:hypothetical protein